VRYSTLELHVCGDWAFERGEFEQLLRPRNEGPPIHERGQYLWVYARNGDGIWRLARIAGAFIHRDEGEGDAAAGVDR
jgi:ketosteroid isomerase-like protein